MKDAEQCFRLNRTRDMFKRVKDIKGDFKKKELFLKDDDGMLITAEKEIAEKWREYFYKLLNCEEPIKKFPFNIENINTQKCTYPTLQEIKGQVHRLKNHKSPGEDCVQAELLKREEKMLYSGFGK